MSGGVAQSGQVASGFTRGTEQLQSLHVGGVGPRPATRIDGVTETLGEIWIWNGSWEPDRMSTAC